MSKKSSNSYLKLKNQEKVLSLQLDRQQHLVGRDRTLVDLLLPEDWQVVGRCQALLRKEGKNYRIYDGDSQKPSTNGLYINQTRITAEKGYLLRNGNELCIGQNPQNQVLSRYCNPNH